MSTTKTLLYRYKIFCETEKREYNKWDLPENIPNCCPINKEHIINSNIEITNKNYDTYLNLDRIVIQEESDNLTGGYFRVDHHTVTCLSNQTTTYNFSYPYPISMLDVRAITKPSNDGDIIDCYCVIPVPVGIITSNVNIGDKELKVNSTALRYSFKGAWLDIADGINRNSLGEITKIYTDKIIVSTPATNNFLTSSPTNAYITIHNAKALTLHKEVPMLTLGAAKQGASVVPENIILRLEYQNKSSDIDKVFNFMIEYLY